MQVHCPGPIGRALRQDQLEGSVTSTPAAAPRNETKLRTMTCAELDALAEGRRQKELECTERAGILCGRHGKELAVAVDVLTHESWHMRGIQDEARTECNSLQTMAGTAMALGATSGQAAALARGQLAESYPLMPDQYRSAQCANGGEMDLRPDDTRWP